MSTAKGIEFYKNKKYNGFNDSDETIKFTILMNNMFNALNRKYPAEGMKKYSRDRDFLYVVLTFCDVSMFLLYFNIACLCL